ncbi:MAG: glycosyltransferase family 2 protein [Candidatus Aenigmarchaeota archaeon]|nr:glycosyltransferase family 2 protein [Candidatus Aenigmarchaeota archaeon]
MKRILVVIPTKNEEKTIASVINNARRTINENKLGSSKFLIIDDSTDSTPAKAKRAGAFIVCGEGKGLGAAMFLGLKKSLAFNPDIIVTIDADGQADANEIPKFVKPILENKADLVIGSRFKNQGLINYNMELSHRIGTKILVQLLRLITKLPLTDSHGGLRAMKRGVVESLEMIGTHSYVQETIIDAAGKGFRVLEVPSMWKRRQYGTTKVVRSIGKYALLTIPMLILRAGLHTMLFNALGIILMLGGFIGFWFVFYQESFSIQHLVNRMPALTLISLLLSVGLQMFFFGFLLNIITDMKNKLDKLSTKKV